MKVSGTKGTSSTSSSRKTSGPKSAGSGFADAIRSLDQGSQTSAAGGIQGTGSVSALDALLALQQSGDALDSPRRRSVARANSLLDQLEMIREALLSGEIPASRLTQLLDVLGHQREQTDDPGLDQVLDEIELRARVELAKLEVASGVMS